MFFSCPVDFAMRTARTRVRGKARASSLLNEFDEVEDREGERSSEWATAQVCEKETAEQRKRERKRQDGKASERGGVKGGQEWEMKNEMVIMSIISGFDCGGDGHQNVMNYLWKFALTSSSGEAKLCGRPRRSKSQTMTNIRVRIVDQIQMECTKANTQIDS